MRSYKFRWLSLVIGLSLLSVPLWGQLASEQQTASADSANSNSDDAQSHIGFPQDWSSRQLVMPGIGLRPDELLAAGRRDPRYVYNLVMRQAAEGNIREQERRPLGAPRPDRHTKVDWAVSLEKGYVPQNQFPAKYGFNLGTENCTSDYVVFGLTVTAGIQANLVGINNLYTQALPACNSGSPWVAFAYNTMTQSGGQIKTSPVLSEDGTKVAFIESTSSGSYFHVLVLPNPIPTPPAQTGTVLSPQTPSLCTYATIAGCMTTLAIEITATNSNSSPWVDYVADVAYVGADNGLLYKIAPVFRGGTPALVSSSDWPVTVSTQPTKVLTSPVEDTTSGRIFIGDAEGYLYAVSLKSPGKTYAARQTIGWAGNGPGTGIIDPPIVVTDPANPGTNQVFTFTGCSSVVGIGGAVSQIAANFTDSSSFTTVDLGSGSGDGDCTGGDVHQGAFDNAFWLTGSATGHLLACGFVSGTSGKPLVPSNPQMYFFPFLSHQITSTGSLTFVVNKTVGEECSPLTEFSNGVADRLFFGVGGTTDGHVETSAITRLLTTPVCTVGSQSGCLTAPHALGGTSGIIIDNKVLIGGSNIYFSTLGAGSVNGGNCKVTGGATNPYCAVKLTQSGLN
jgi:hypothetical protein